MKKDYDECVRLNLIKPITKLDDRGKEIVALAKHKLTFWNKVMKTAEDYPTVLIESHYEIIKELLTALMGKEGLKSDTHDCLFYYFEEKHKDLEIDFNFLQDLRVTRNNINYQGVKAPKEAWKDSKLKISLTIKYLIECLEKKD
ncbi:hypothetical protein HZA97_07555 [Candidatus Woesearchaeota archaeon]|nr:hypothetical protein [Candidatus Woesearchaeota archaeon]